MMALKTKLAKILGSLTHKTSPGYCSVNSGFIKNRVGPVGVVGSSFSSSFAAAAACLDDSGSRYVGYDYGEYRRALYGGSITHKALLVDAVGTLLIPSQPMAQIYRQMGEKYGVDYSEDEILNRYRRAYEQPWGRSRLRYVNDGRPFWQYIVSSSTGCSDTQYFEELYNYYTTEKAWHLCDPDAEKVFKALRKAGVKIAVVSNFDTRLRPLLRALNCDQWFDAVAVSAEVAAEKPNPTIFLRACELLDVKPEDAVHVGDDRRNDIWGARDAGCDAWLWGSDVHSFKEVAQRIGVQNLKNQLLDVQSEKDRLRTWIEGHQSCDVEVDYNKKSNLDRVLQSKEEVELTKRISILEAQMHNNEVSNNKERTKLRMRLRGTQGKLDTFRSRHKEAVYELDYMNRQYKAASGMFKERLASYGSEFLNLKKQLATEKGL